MPEEQLIRRSTDGLTVLLNAYEHRKLRKKTIVRKICTVPLAGPRDRLVASPIERRSTTIQRREPSF